MSISLSKLLGLCCFTALCVVEVLFHQLPLTAQEQPKDLLLPKMTVGRTDDFTIDGSGNAKPWAAAQWTQLQRREGGKLEYEARIKTLYSSKGIYVLFDGSDQLLTSTMQNDFDDLWNEDVYECFFWPDEQHSIYFEYEISPLGYELPILVPQMDGKFLGWRPWHYEGERKIQKAVSAKGGKNESLAKVDGWRAEVFIPYALLNPLQNVPPKPGSTWRANFYRVDYDHGQKTGWHWAPVGSSFHDIKKFGTLTFE